MSFQYCRQRHHLCSCHRSLLLPHRVPRRAIESLPRNCDPPSRRISLQPSQICRNAANALPVSATLPSPLTSPTIASARQVRPLTYLPPSSQAVIKESMRLCPSLGIPLERLTPSGGVVLCDRFLPQGTNVSMCASALHHLPSVFGEDASTFRPERWIEADARALENMKRCYFAVSLPLPLSLCPFPRILLALLVEGTQVGK